MPPLPKIPTTENLFFNSGRILGLRFVTLVCLIPVPLTLWLVSSLPPNGWNDNPFGPALWWVIPTALIALAAVLPLSLRLLHDRYVLRLERNADGTWQLTTLLLWGRRVRAFSSDDLAGATLEEDEGRFDSRLTVSVSAPFLRVRLPSRQQLIFDRQCEAPHGWAALEAVFSRPASRPARPTVNKPARKRPKK